MPVARIGESVSYSDKLKEQAQLINKRRQQNLNVEIAQEEKNRQFRDQQLQTFYDFDVSGMSAEHIKAIGKLQANMANSLDPNSEDHYQDTQQLIADISFLNNAYNVASRHRDQRQSGAQQMVGLMTGEVEANPGEEFVNEGIDGLNNANALWDQGGFSGEINVGGSAGNRSMSGVPLVPNPDGGWMSGEGEVSFFENSLTNDSSPLYRPTIIASAPTLNKMAEEAMSDEALNGTNTEEVADLRWSTMISSKKERIRKEEYDKVAKEGETTAFEDLTDDQKTDLKIDDESLRNKYRDKLQEGIDARGFSTELPPSFLGGSVTQTEYGNAIKLTDPKTGKDRTVSLISGGERRTVTNVGFSGKGDDTQVFYIYTDPDNPNGYREAVVPFDSTEGMSLINDTGSIGAIAKMVGVSVEDLENIEPVANSGEEGGKGGEEEGGEEGGKGGEEEGEEDVVQASTGPAVNPIDNYKSAINSLLEANPLTGTTSGSGDFFRSDLGKFANRIKDMSIAQQATEVDKEIRRLKGVRSQERFSNPESYQRSQTWRNADKALKKLEEVQSMQEGLDTPENRDIAVEDIRTRIDEKKQELIESENISDRNSRKKTRDRINQDIVELEQGLEGLDLFANREESNSNTAIQGEGAGIAYSKPRPPQDISLLEVGNASSGSTSEERKLAFGEATRMAREAGHPFPEVVAAQFAKESAYGKETGGEFNYFGLKSGNAIIKRLKDAGIVATAADKVNTDEIINDKTVTIKDSFLSFESPEDGFMAYLIFIDTVKKKNEDGSYVRRYGPALDEAETAYDYVKQINELGYSTTPPKAYADSTNAIAQGFGVDLREITREPQGTASN